MCPTMSRDAETLENLLIRIVINNELSEQSQFQEKLKENGVDIPQSTLSRWLKKLNIVKVNNRYQMLSQETLSRIPVFSIKMSLPNLILLTTLPGNANALAYQIDQKIQNESGKTDPYYGVLGTIAGDDTVLVIMQDKETLMVFKDRLEKNIDNFYILYD